MSDDDDGLARPQAMRLRDLSYDALMRIHLEPEVDGNAQSPTVSTRDTPDPLARRVHSSRVHHSARHILTTCPRTAHYRESILQGSSFHHLFHQVKGGISLANFFLRSNMLLRPLPARPDPP